MRTEKYDYLETVVANELLISSQFHKLVRDGYAGRVIHYTAGNRLCPINDWSAQSGTTIIGESVDSGRDKDKKALIMFNRNGKNELLWRQLWEKLGLLPG